MPSKEEICRRLLRQITGKNFIKDRPNFLRNPKTGKNLELDCYSHELKLAIEYDGPYHFTTGTMYTPNSQALREVWERDRMKERLCLQHGVWLIRVPFIIRRDQLFDFLKTAWETYRLKLKR